MAGDGAKTTALIVGGTALGVGLAALFGARPVKGAIDTEKLDYIASLLEQLNVTELEVLTAIKGISISPGGVTVEVLSLWKAKEPEHIFEQAIRSIGVFQSDTMVDFRNGKRLLFKIESTLDQAVTIQVIGNQSDTFNLATNIDGPFAVAANGNITIGLAWDDWHPYVGIIITAAIAPAAGILSIWSMIQE